jgi:hypothetical protein
VRARRGRRAMSEANMVKGKLGLGRSVDSCTDNLMRNRVSRS